MSTGNGGRSVHPTESRAVGVVPRNALWQRGTNDLERRSTVLSRDRILSWVGLPLTRLQQETRRPEPAPLAVDRGHHPSIVAGHGRQTRSAVRHRGSPRRGTAAAAEGALARASTDFASGLISPGELTSLVAEGQ